MSTDTPTLIEAMRQLATDIQSEDGVANAAIFEAALRLEEQHKRIKRLEEAGDAMAHYLVNGPYSDDVIYQAGERCLRASVWNKAKEAKP